MLPAAGMHASPIHSDATGTTIEPCLCLPPRGQSPLASPPRNAQCGLRKHMGGRSGCGRCSSGQLQCQRHSRVSLPDRAHRASSSAHPTHRCPPPRAECAHSRQRAHLHRVGGLTQLLEGRRAASCSRVRSGCRTAGFAVITACCLPGISQSCSLRSSMPCSTAALMVGMLCQ